MSVPSIGWEGWSAGWGDGGVIVSGEVFALTRDCGMFLDHDPSESSVHVREYNV